jgi:hypothetical protein
MMSRPAARNSVARASAAPVGDGLTRAMRFETDKLKRLSPAGRVNGT